MSTKVRFSSILVIIAMMVVAVFAQSGDNVEPSNTPDEETPSTEPEKVHESLTLQYKISPIPMKYLFTSKTEVNAKIENLDDESKNKDVVSTMSSSTTLKLTSDEVTTDNFKIKVAIEKISGAYDVDGKSAEFTITKDGMKTKVDGEEDAEIRELDAWRNSSPDSLGKTIAEFTLTKNGKIKNAVSHTSGGTQGGGNTYLGESNFDKSLIYLQNPLTLINLLFWDLPEKTLEFNRVGNNPAKPAPSWKSSIEYPFTSPFELDTVESECSITQIITEKQKEEVTEKKEGEEKPEENAEEKPEMPADKIVRISRTIKHPTEKDTLIVAYLDYDVNKGIPVLVTFDIYRNTVLNPTDNRKVTVSQKTTYSFILQK